MGVLLLLLIALQGGGTLSLVSTGPLARCLTNPLDLLPDPEDCHIFYQCDLNPQPMSCGDMMFNSLRQICDWPSKVLQIRPECRSVERLKYPGQEYPFRRTLRMLKFFGNGDQFSQKRLRAPQDVGLGRPKNFGNKYFARRRVVNIVQEDDDDYYEDYEDDKYHENINDINQFNQEESDYNYNDDISNLDFNIQEIKKSLPPTNRPRVPLKTTYHQNQIPVQTVSTKSVSSQAVSTPADTIRIGTHQASISTAPHVTRPKPSHYIHQAHLSSVAVRPQVPSSVYQHPITRHTVSSPAYSVQSVSHTAPVSAPVQAPRDSRYILTDQEEDTQLMTSSNEDVAADAIVNETQKLENRKNVTREEQPKLAPILVEDTREFKPVWTVTRERPRQILLKYGNTNKQNRQAKQKVLRKIKRKLINEDLHQLEQRRNSLNVGDEKSKEDIKKLQDYINETFNEDKKKVLTLKEAYDSALSKIDQSVKTSKPDPSDLLREIVNRDFGSRKEKKNTKKYVSSDDLRSEYFEEDAIEGREV